MASLSYKNIIINTMRIENAKRRSSSCICMDDHAVMLLLVFFLYRKTKGDARDPASPFDTTFIVSIFAYLRWAPGGGVTGLLFILGGI